MSTATDKRERPAPDSDDSASESPADKQLRLESESEDEASRAPLPLSSDDEWGVVGSWPWLHPRPQEEAERLVDTFVSRAASVRFTTTTRELQRTAYPARMRAFRDACSEGHATDAPIQLHELEKVIPDTDTFPGEDKIPYAFLRHAGFAMLDEIVNLFNASYSRGTVPATWKTAIIVPIPKSGDGGEFPPISLLSCLGKTMERILLSRLRWAMGALHHHLIAFRRGMGTRDCVSTLLSGVLGRQAVVVFLDLEKAFELASVPAVLSILAEKGVRGRLLACIGQYLQDRRAAAHFQGCRSTTRAFENGTPQVGVLSPVLFNMLVEKLKAMPYSRYAQVLSYADDVAMVVSGPNHVASARFLLRRLSQTCASLGLVINRGKMKAMAIHHRCLPEPLDLDGTPVPWVHVYKYLGVTLDSRLSFAPYLNHLRQAMVTRTNIMRSLARTAGGASDRVLRLFYLQAVRACVDYGTPCLMTVDPAALQPLETAQNAAIRTILRAPRWTKCICMRAEMRISTVATRVNQLAVGHLVTLLRRRRSEPLRASVEQALHQAPLLFRRKTWASVAATKLRSTSLSRCFLMAQDLPHPSYTTPPPWAPATFTATIKPLPVKKALLTPHRLAREARNRETEAARPIAGTYYTDGSVNHLTGAVGAAFITAGHAEMVRLPDGSSSTQAELVALNRALGHAVEWGRGPVLVHCDSVPAIRSLYQDPLNDNVSLLTGIHARLQELGRAGRQVHLNWLPSHAGVVGNDAADRAAGEATLLPSVTCPVSPSVSLLKRDMEAHTSAGVVRALAEALAAGSPSAHWYALATGSGSRRLPLGVPRRVASNLHRLRLGYRCSSLLDIDDPVPVDCPYSAVVSSGRIWFVVHAQPIRKGSPIEWFVLACFGPVWRRGDISPSHPLTHSPTPSSSRALCDSPTHPAESSPIPPPSRH
ncbi:uncharacterized protein LOC126994835 [Eriocheir sinensis]|uniref:uncharacterized protein LOC126994835 n=1 Tax=Eriocheir sinensis TaxID=95602 RepID=UPI0021CA3E3E|nr:uncharacterized protein LOC126994835 [Eriocheir sinensis]